MNESILHELERLALAYSRARAVMAERVHDLQREIEILRNRRLKGIKPAAAEAQVYKKQLEVLIAEHPELFQKQRTLVLHGIKLGLQKGRGAIEFADEAAVIARVEKLLPDQADVLIRTTKKLVKKALRSLDAKTLAKIGCTVTETGDQVLIKSADDEIDKLVARILEEGASKIEEGAAVA